MLRNYSKEDWRIIKSQIADLEDTLVWDAVLTLLRSRKSKYQRELESFSHDDTYLRFCQGAIEATNSDIIVLKELRRMADKCIKEG